MCAENGKYTMAREYLVKSQAYRHADTGTTGSDSLFNRVFHKIYGSWTATCDSLAAHGDFEEAVNCYRQLENRIDTSLHQGRKDIDRRINLATNSMKSDPFGKIQYRDELIKQLHQSESLIWTGRYKAAGIFADSVEKQFRTNGLEDDSEVLNILGQYRKKIREQVCWDATEAFGILFIRAQTKIN